MLLFRIFVRSFITQRHVYKDYVTFYSVNNLSIQYRREKSPNGRVFTGKAFYTNPPMNTANNRVW